MTRRFGWLLILVFVVAMLWQEGALNPLTDLLLSVLSLVGWILLLTMVGVLVFVVFVQLLKLGVFGRVSQDGPGGGTSDGHTVNTIFGRVRQDGPGGVGQEGSAGGRADGYTAHDLSEQDMESLLAQYPGELLKEPLIFDGRQRAVGNDRVDLVFREAANRLLFVEVKRVPVTRKHIGQVLEYLTLLGKEYPRRGIRMKLVSPVIAPIHRESLGRVGVEWQEISQQEFYRVGEEHGI